MLGALRKAHGYLEQSQVRPITPITPIATRADDDDSRRRCATRCRPKVTTEPLPLPQVRDEVPRREEFYRGPSKGAWPFR